MATPAETGKVTSRWRYWSSRIAIAVLVPASLLGITEVVLRVSGVGFPTEVTRLCTVRGRPAFCDNLFFAATYFPPHMIRTPIPYAIPAEKPNGTFRIFILGESAAYGDPAPSYGFGRYLEVMLRERFPKERFEVVNTSITAINSHALLPIAREMAPRQPDLFIIYAGNNEVVGPFGPGTVLTSSALRLRAIRANIFIRSTRLGQLLTRVVSKQEKGPREWRGMEMFLGKQVPADSALMSRVYENFASNLSDMISATRGSGARVLLSTIGTNLKDCAPFASLHRDGLGQDALRSWTELVQQGQTLQAAGSYAEALQRYLSAADIDSQYAELHFRIARCLWILGDYPAAKEHFVRAQDLDTLRFRADTRINDIIRSVAGKSGSSVGLVDAAAIYAEHSPHGISGSEFFYEHVHMNPEGNYLLARALFPQIVNALPPEVRSSAGNVDLLSQAECDRLLALTRYDRARLAADMLARLQKPPFTNQLNHYEQILNLEIQARAPIDSYEDTAAQYEAALAKNPDDRLLHLTYGLFLNGRDRTAALEHFRRSRAYDDVPFVTPDGTLVY